MCSIRQLEAAVKFTYSLPFVNPSRASHGLVVYDGGKICFNKGENSKQGRNTVFLTTGLIVESQLKIAADSTINPEHKVRYNLWLRVSISLSARFDRFFYFPSSGKYNDCLLTSALCFKWMNMFAC
jgi:hypothetical protein